MNSKHQVFKASRVIQAKSLDLPADFYLFLFSKEHSCLGTFGFPGKEAQQLNKTGMGLCTCFFLILVLVWIIWQINSLVNLAHYNAFLM